MPAAQSRSVREILLRHKYSSLFHGGDGIGSPSATGAPSGSAATPSETALDPRLAGLTARQMAVYRAATRGLSNKLIARQLDIAESTVKAHLSAVYSALGVRNRTEAAYQASREGMHIG